MREQTAKLLAVSRLQCKPHKRVDRRWLWCYWVSKNIPFVSNFASVFVNLSWNVCWLFQAVLGCHKPTVHILLDGGADITCSTVNACFGKKSVPRAISTLILKHMAVWVWVSALTSMIGCRRLTFLYCTVLYRMLNYFHVCLIHSCWTLRWIQTCLISEEDYHGRTGTASQLLK